MSDNAIVSDELRPDLTLLALVGLAPAVASETFWALAHRRETVSHIVLATTRRGALLAEQQLLGTAGALARVAANASPPVPLPAIKLVVLTDGNRSLDDIQSGDDHLAVQTALDHLVRRLTTTGAPPLHASLAGGRKTMSAAMALAMSIHARPQDRLSHVLVASPYLENPDFLFPAAGDEAAARAISLIDMPFIRLRPLLPERWREQSTPKLIAAAQSHIDAAAPARLGLAERTLRCGDETLILPPLQAAFLATLACSTEGFGVLDLPVDRLAEAYRATGASVATAADLAGRLAADGADVWLREMVSRLQSRLRAGLAPQWSRRLVIERLGGRPATRYRLIPGSVVMDGPDI
jgi:CRISPR-associated protein (TIGR02584 family)